jgi:hypothetical protein
MGENPRSNEPKDKQVEQALEFQRLEFETTRALRDDEREELRFKAEGNARRWSQLAVVLPLLTAVLGYFVQSALARHNVQLRFIDRQLSQFYYPIQLRLKKDDALFVFWQKNKDNKENTGVLNELRHGSMLKNHEQVISEQNSNLLRNPDENTDLQPLMQSFFLYERHVALLSASQAVKDDRTPWEVDHEFGYPKSLADQINSRVHQLEEQRRKLTTRPF